MAERSLKVFDQALTALHPSIRPLDHPSSSDWDKSSFPLSGFFGFGGFGCQFKPDLGQNLGIEFLHSCGDGVWVIAVVKQDSNLRDIDGLGAKVILVMACSVQLSLGHRTHWLWCSA
jgi:hypothetical protein